LLSKKIQLIIGTNTKQLGQCSVVKCFNLFQQHHLIFQSYYYLYIQRSMADIKQIVC